MKKSNPKESSRMVEATVHLLKLWDKKWEKLMIRLWRNSTKLLKRIIRILEMSKLKMPHWKSLRDKKTNQEQWTSQSQVKVVLEIGGKEILACQSPKNLRFNRIRIQVSKVMTSNIMPSNNTIKSPRPKVASNRTSNLISSYMLNNKWSLRKIVEPKRNWSSFSKINKTKANTKTNNEMHIS